MTVPPSPTAALPPAPVPAKMRPSRFQFVWLIPLLAAAIAGYLGYRTFLEQGPLLTLTFATADGLQAGQTQLKYKAVALGIVESIDLSHDHTDVVVRVRMNEAGKPFLNSNARYWVERPRLTLTDTEGLETLVNGVYISVDPGAPGGSSQNNFTGLDEPPGIRSDEPGSTYTLTTENVGSLNTGSPVFYRGATVGEVLGYSIGDDLAPVKLSIFVRAPYDSLIRPDTRFWDVSGLEATVQAGVLQVQMQSVAALIGGGVSFSLPDWAVNEHASPGNATFPLYPTRDAADAASYRSQIPLVTYLTGDVSGLTPGEPVTLLGIQVGDVTDVDLQVDGATGTARVRVAMQVQPERVVGTTSLNHPADLQAVMQRLVDHGLRAALTTGSYVTGQKRIALNFVPHAAPAEVTREGGALVLPAQNGGLDTIIANAADITSKLDALPYAELAGNLDKLLLTANGTLGSKGLNDTLNNLATTLNNVNSGLGPDSDVQRNLLQLLQETSTTVQSLNTLTTDLDHHPQSLLLGRSAP